MTRRASACAGVLAAFLLGAASPAPAKTIYKIQMPDGRIVYSDEIIEGGKILDQAEVKQAPAATPAPAPSAAEAEAVTLRLRERMAQIDRAHEEIVSAAQALEQAKRRLEAGKEPLAGERQGQAGGGARLSPQYFERVRELENDVAQAQARLDHAYRNFNEVR